MDSLIERARAWMEDDPDPDTRAELLALIEADDRSELAERFAARLEFGTAGIRGPLGAGPARMNRALVRKVTAGLAAYLLQAVPDVRERGVVVGRDARHRSREFAEDTAGVLAASGIRVHSFPDVVPTPLLAYAVTTLGARAGVMITASHNPPADNGYKVYWGNGAQIVPPHDRGISEAIDRVGASASIAVLDVGQAGENGLLRTVPESIGERYVSGVLKHRRNPGSTGHLRIVYTPLHGVGGRWVRTVFQRAGFRDLVEVTEQFEPDPDFPTVVFPNPEEPGAMDLALAGARHAGAELVLANDPDADRLAALVRTGEGVYRPLSGNEIGVAMAYYLLTEKPKTPRPLVMTTIVSSCLLRKMAEALGASYAETLTGYKWIANGAIERKERGEEFVFGYEEALGYTVGDLVRDKDGIGAALVLAELAAFCKARGETLVDWVEGIYRRFGLHLSGARSFTLPGSKGAARILELMSRLRGAAPSAIGGIPVAARGDIRSGVRLDPRSRNESRIDLPSSNVLYFELEDGSRILARPSGTEPKIKFYFEVVEAVGDREAFGDAETRARRRLEGLTSAFLESQGLLSNPS